MCRLFQTTDKASYSVLTRKLRIHGHSTSVRLERGFWAIIEEMARFEGKSVGRLITSLHDEIRRTETDLTNFASCLRVIALHYVIGGTGGFVIVGSAQSAATLVAGNNHGH